MADSMRHTRQAARFATHDGLKIVICDNTVPDVIIRVIRAEVPCRGFITNESARVSNVLSLLSNSLGRNIQLLPPCGAPEQRVVALAAPAIHQPEPHKVGEVGSGPEVSRRRRFDLLLLRGVGREVFKVLVAVLLDPRRDPAHKVAHVGHAVELEQDRAVGVDGLAGGKVEVGDGDFEPL